MSELTSATRYGVLRGDVEHEIEIKRSRFICYLSRVETQAEAREYIDLIRSEHRLARHHCTAFVTGADRMVQRSNDDGEPSGTAGLPMLEALTLFTRPGERTADLSDTIAVVVRYFGGVLLGAGGLVRAYSDSVSQALAGARFHTRQRMRLLTLAAPHADVGRWENELRTSGFEILGTEYGDIYAKLRLAVADEAESVSRIEQRVAALTQGQEQVVDAGTAWVDLGG